MSAVKNLAAAMMALCLAGLAYMVVQNRPVKFAVVDIAGVFRAKEAEFSNMLINNADPAERKKAREYAQDFARRYPLAMEQLAQECACMLLDKTVVIGSNSAVPDLTPKLLEKVK